jgi:uncharacterized membrane protein YphA (DoxX/SURF4 family)
VSTNLTQLFARIIVCAVFLPTGARHLFQHESFTPDEAARIERMGSPAAEARKAVNKVKPASLREPAAEGGEEGERQFRGLNRIALRLDDAHVPMPVVVAWVVAIAEFAGALSVLVGFLCRITCPALTLTGVFMLWRVVWPAIGGAMPWMWTPGQAQQATFWLAGTLLPVSIFLLGPGKPSIEAAMKSGKGGKGGAKKPAETD